MKQNPAVIPKASPTTAPKPLAVPRSRGVSVDRSVQTPIAASDNEIQRLNPLTMRRPVFEPNKPQSNRESSSRDSRSGGSSATIEPAQKRGASSTKTKWPTEVISRNAAPRRIHCVEAVTLSDPTSAPENPVHHAALKPGRAREGGWPARLPRRTDVGPPLRPVARSAQDGGFSVNARPVKERGVSW